MGIPGAANPLLLVSASGYQIERSLRFNAADSAYLSRTPASAGNRKTWTWAGWVKRSTTGGNEALMYINSPNNNAFRFEQGTGYIRLFFNGATDANLETTSVYRDCSSWYHLVFAIDTTQTTASNRVKIYVNGQQITAFSVANYPTQNYESAINSAVAHNIGRNPSGAEYLNGYLADIHFIDGQALTPTSFGETDANGIWQPKAYTGTYGTNGFRLPFSDNSTAAALGTDTSGNGNTWTVNNLSVLSAGTGNYSPSTSVLAYGSPPGNVFNMFDGSLSTYAYTRYTQNITRFTPPTAIPYSSSVEIYVFRGNGTVPSGSVTVTSYIFNGGANTIFQGSNTPGWVTVATGSGSLNYIEYRSFKSIGWQSTSDWYAIRIDGVILVDQSLSAGNDSLVDTPTSYGTDTGVGGEVRGNYCTLNPLAFSTPIINNGNLETTGNNNWYSAFGTIKTPATGKWYWEALIGNATSIIGIAKALPSVNTYLSNWADTYGWYGSEGAKSTGPSYAPVAYASYSASNIVGVAYDAGAGSLTYYRNGVSQGVAFTGLSGEFYPVFSTYGVGVTSFNFGQRPFAYAAPSGFKALCTTNIPEGTITTSGTFTGNALTDGPFVYLNGVPTAMTINGNTAVFGSNVDKLSNGFKLRTSNAGYNNSGSNTYSVTTTGAKFKVARAQPNP
jgi:hypothetical protein